MHDSLIVQVNEQGKVIGPIKYSQAHPKSKTKKGIRHMNSNILVFEDLFETKLLLQMRGKGTTRSRVWDCSAGGHSDWLFEPDEKGQGQPEKSLVTAYRELGEELFYKKTIPETLKLIEICSFPIQTRPNNPEFIHLFKGYHNKPFFPNPEEVDDLSFKELIYILEDISQHPEKYANSFKACLTNYLESSR